jgi:hypothetical protein
LLIGQDDLDGRQAGVRLVVEVTLSHKLLGEIVNARHSAPGHCRCGGGCGLASAVIRCHEKFRLEQRSDPGAYVPLAVHAQFDRLLEAISEKLPTVAEHLDAARAEVIATMPARRKNPSAGSIAQVCPESGVGIFGSGDNP